MKPKKLQQSPISTPTTRRLVGMLGLSLALHAPLLLKDRVGEVVEQRGNITHAAKEAVKSVLSSHPREKAVYVDKLKEALKNGEHIDLGEFYLKSQYLAGRLEKDRIQGALDELASLEAKVRADKDKLDTLDVLQGITNKQGNYSLKNSYLSTLLLEGKGNCSARERFMSVLIDRVYPDMEIVYQKVKLDGGPHTRALVKVDGKWRNMEYPTAAPLTSDDLAGTVLYKKYDYVKHYVGQGNLGSYKPSPKPIDSYTRIMASDAYMAVPLPDGISMSDIKSIPSNPAALGGARTGAVGQGSIGSPARPGVGGYPGSYDGRQREVVVNIFYDPDYIKRNRRQTAKILLNLNNFKNYSDEAREKYFRKWLPSIPVSCLEDLTSLFMFVAMQLSRECHIGASGEMTCPGLPVLYKDASQNPDPNSFDGQIQEKIDKLSKNLVCTRYFDDSKEVNAFAKHLEDTYGIDL